MLDFSDLAGSGLNETVLLCVAGGVAVLFFLVVLYDTFRGKRHKPGRKSARGRPANSDENFLGQVRNSWKTLRETANQRKRIRARLESNSEVRPAVPPARFDTKV